jgi:hypothetical protein
MYVEFGSARATATLTAGVVTSCSVTNAGFGFTLAPDIEFFGGGAGGNSTFVGVGLFGFPSPGSRTVGPTAILNQYRPAKAHCVLTAGIVSSIVVDDGGNGYITAPYVAIRNRELDPKGCADPSVSSGTGIFLGSSQSLTMNGTFCATDSIAIFGSGTGSQAFTCRWAP